MFCNCDVRDVRTGSYASSYVCKSCMYIVRYILRAASTAEHQWMHYALIVSEIKKDTPYIHIFIASCLIFLMFDLLQWSSKPYIDAPIHPFAADI